MSENTVKNANVKMFNFRLLFSKFLEAEPQEISQDDEILQSQDIGEEEKKLLTRSLNKSGKLAKELFEVKDKKPKKGKLDVQNVKVNEVLKKKEKEQTQEKSEIQKEITD